MQILQGDEWAIEMIAKNFLEELCTEELRPQAEQLFADKNWIAFDQLMAPFYNIEQ